jgi:hypothetical protein
MSSLIAVARSDSRRWWYHRELRQQGKVTTARERAHSSTRTLLQNIRDAKQHGGFLTKGRGGYSFFYTTLHSHTEGCHPGSVDLAIRCGIPMIDTTTIPDERIVSFAFNLPLVSLDPKRWEQDLSTLTSWSYVSPALKIALARAWDATITNDPGHPLPEGLPAAMLPPDLNG